MSPRLLLTLAALATLVLTPGMCSDTVPRSPEEDCPLAHPAKPTACMDSARAVRP